MRVGLVFAACGLVLLAGCSSGFSGLNQTEDSQTPVAGAKLTGTVHGGQNPISGAHVYLFAAASGAGGAGQAAYGGSGIAASASNASVSLLSAASTGHSDAVGAYVLTGSDGSFSISGDYTCTAGQQVYLYTLGGDPGLGTGANSAAGLMTALGSCPAGGNFLSGSTPITSVMVNEVSTVAAAYAMAGFATDATHVGSSGTALALTGIGNAFVNAANLETIGTGVALAYIPYAYVPQAEINTLANILAACVNSNGAGSACTTLFANAKSAGTTGTAATDTATAAINVAHNPGTNVASLYALAVSTPPFAPVLTTQPNDFTIVLSFYGPYSGTDLAIDGSGDVWVTAGQNVVEFSSLGASLRDLSTPSGLSYPTYIAIDPSGNAWVAATGTSPSTNDVIEVSSGGGISGPFQAGSGTQTPEDLTVDGSGDVWVLLDNLTAIKLSSTGTPLSSPFGLSGSNAAAITIDSSGNAWFPNPFCDTVAELSNTGSVLSGSNGYPVDTHCGSGFAGLGKAAIDANGSLWMANTISNGLVNRVVELSSGGSVISGTNGYTGGGLSFPRHIAVDGSGHAWVTNHNAGSLTELSNSGTAISTANGFYAGGASPDQIAIDGSGNVWITDPMTEFVGAATPVVTPLSVGAKNNTLGTRP
jgi:streptogramin lyase